MRPHLLRRVLELAEKDPNVIFLTGDVGYGFTDPLRDRLGERFINCGVAEANMISVAAGLAGAGLTPFIYSIVPFVTLRCLEQIRNDLAYHRAPARILGMGAGFTYGAQGPSHHALEDLHVLAAIPGLAIVNCANRAELDFVFADLEALRAPLYFRIGKDRGPEGPTVEPIGRAYRVRSGTDVNIVASGHLLGEAIAATEILDAGGVSVNLISCPWLLPFPTGELRSRLVSAPIVSVVEAYAGNILETALVGGGRFRAVSVARDFSSRVGDAEFLRRAAGLDRLAIAAAARSIL